MTINELYRQQGWGQITDKALGLEPENVESQARCVAAWAFEEIERLRGALFAADEAITELNGCFPLDRNTLRQRKIVAAAQLVRAETGDDYQERKARASAALFKQRQTWS